MIFNKYRTPSNILGPGQTLAILGIYGGGGRGGENGKYQLCSWNVSEPQQILSLCIWAELEMAGIEIDIRTMSQEIFMKIVKMLLLFFAVYFLVSPNYN